MKIILLSSTRADYSIYRPLLKKMCADDFFTVNIVAFGAHLSEQYGYTVQNFLADGFHVYKQLNTIPDGDSPREITDSIAKTIALFSEFWEQEKQNTDIIIALGDRYEMFAAVAASVAFNLKVAHIHGGETTQGAIDNVFRHSISLFSTYHFTATENSARRVAQIIGTEKHIYTVGALSLDNLKELSLLSLQEFKEKYNVDLSVPTLLVTYHPETIAYESNEQNATIIAQSLIESGYQCIITMPNADTYGHSIRKVFKNLNQLSSQIHIFENLGTVGYFSAMKHCAFLIGNSSSGIIEAASFGKYVIDLGHRQAGREAGNNVLRIPTITKEHILKKIREIETLPPLSDFNIYGNGNTADKIISILKTIVP